MKVIDLLNKIANGEEVPKEFKFNSENYKLKNGKYLDESNDSILFNINYDLSNLNDVIELQKGIPEKIEIYEDEEGHYFIDKHCKKIYITCDEVNFMVEEFNQLIDYLKSKGE